MSVPAFRAVTGTRLARRAMPPRMWESCMMKEVKLLTWREDMSREC
jgi:hypothetical protein